MGTGRFLMRRLASFIYISVYFNKKKVILKYSMNTLVLKNIEVSNTLRCLGLANSLIL
jgi:hypothetical protein